MLLACALSAGNIPTSELVEPAAPRGRRRWPRHAAAFPAANVSARVPRSTNWHSASRWLPQSLQIVFVQATSAAAHEREIAHHNRWPVQAALRPRGPWPSGPGELVALDACAHAADSAECGWQTSLSEDSHALPASQEIATGREHYTCSGGQVLANSQRWFKFERRSFIAFAMLSDGCTVSRECLGCPSVWVKFYLKKA